MNETNFFTNPDDAPESIEARSAPKRAESDAANRCLWSDPINHVQCKDLALRGKQVCAKHDISGRNERKSRYNLIRHATNLDEMMGDKDFTNMNAEISMLRILLQTYWNKCETDMDFVMHGSKIEGVIEKMQRVLTMSKKLEMALGNVVDKSGFDQFTNEVLQIISEEVQDKAIILRIGKRTGVAIERAIAKSAQEAQERLGSQ